MKSMHLEMEVHQVEGGERVSLTCPYAFPRNGPDDGDSLQIRGVVDECHRR